MELAHKRSGRADFKTLLATRRGTLAVAIVTAVVAAIILVLAINRYRQSVTAASTQDTVLVANRLIEKGTSGSEIAAGLMYTPTKIVEKHLSTGAMADAAALSGRVAITNILPGQQLTAADFAPTAGVASQLAANQRAISVPLDSSHGLSGVVQAGDHVDIYVGVNTTAGGPQIRLLVPNVLVLQAGASGNSGLAAGSTSGNVVLAVSDNVAPEVAYASDNGKIWLVLRPGNAQSATQTVATLQSILLGQPALPGGGGR